MADEPRDDAAAPPRKRARQGDFWSTLGSPRKTLAPLVARRRGCETDRGDAAAFARGIAVDRRVSTVEERAETARMTPRAALSRDGDLPLMGRDDAESTTPRRRRRVDDAATTTPRRRRRSDDAATTTPQRRRCRDDDAAATTMPRRRRRVDDAASTTPHRQRRTDASTTPRRRRDAAVATRQATTPSSRGRPSTGTSN